MNRRLLYAVGIVFVVLAFGAAQVGAQGALTLESLAERIDKQDAQIVQMLRRMYQLETKISKLQREVFPTETPTPRPTRRPTATPRPTAAPQQCNQSGIPEPPAGFQLNCDAWKVSFQLVSLAIGGEASNILPRIARQFYPLVVDAARNCGVSVYTLGDLVYTGSEQMKSMGKPSDGGSPIGYLLGAMATPEFKQMVKDVGSCKDTLTLVILASD